MIQRPWDGSFDEYLTYSLPRSGSRARTHAAADLKYTDSQPQGLQRRRHRAGSLRRRVRSRASTRRGSRGCCANAAAFVGLRRAVHQGRRQPARPRSSARPHKVAPGWMVTDAMVDEFRSTSSSERVKIDEAAFKADLTFIKAMIRFEVDVDLFGVEEARAGTSPRSIPQVQAALGYFDEARSCSRSARRRQ